LCRFRIAPRKAIAPAHVAYTNETTFTVKAAVTFELP
jgi:hypothetical protein